MRRCPSPSDELADLRSPGLTIEATFEEHDDAYLWLLAWLSTPERQLSARSFEVSTRPDVLGGSSALGQTSDDKSARSKLDSQLGLALLPSFESTRYLRFQDHTLRFARRQDTKMFGNPTEKLTVTAFARDQTIIRDLIKDARAVHVARDETRVVIHAPSQDLEGWTRNRARPPRKLESIVLPQGVKERIVKDVQDFLDGESWYAQRGESGLIEVLGFPLLIVECLPGIPHRRGYLFYGVPGSGKTSLIHALAGTLGLNIYVVNLAQNGYASHASASSLLKHARSLDDASLGNLIRLCPSRSIVLMEDM